MMMQVAVFAEPSDWAVEFVENATIEGLIPETLKLDYQNNIKRFEYVLMALKVLEQNNVEVEIKDAEAFVDISSHPYKSEIIKAYNAGIVGGYEDKTFRPDQEISREEVAALVFNLVKTINVSTELPNTESLFSDMNKISEWARPYIEFNYSKSIISGIGKIEGLDTIDPQGKTTREQAITLLYKVSKDNDLLAKYGFDSVSTENGLIDKSVVNIIAKKIGTNVFEATEIIVKEGDAKYHYIDETSISLIYGDGSIISLLNFPHKESIDLKIYSIESDNVISDYNILYQLMFSNIDITSMVNDQLALAKNDTNYELMDLAFGDGIVTCLTIDTLNELFYSFEYGEGK
jgi:hypothetical protein